MSIADQLKKLEKDPAFQKKIKDKRLAAMKNGQSFGKAINGVSSEEEARRLFDRVINEVRNAIDEMFRGNSGVFVNGYGPTVTANGEYRFEIYFRNVHRESLYPEGYPEGLENIVALFSKGSKPSKNAVWNRQEIMIWNKKQDRPGEYRLGQHGFFPKGYQTMPHPQLRDAIDRLNQTMKYQGVKVVLDPIYY